MSTRLRRRSSRRRTKRAVNTACSSSAPGQRRHRWRRSNSRQTRPHGTLLPAIASLVASSICLCRMMGMLQGNKSKDEAVAVIDNFQDTTKAKARDFKFTMNQRKAPRQAFVGEDTNLVKSFEETTVHLLALAMPRTGRIGPRRLNWAFKSRTRRMAPSHCIHFHHIF